MLREIVSRRRRLIRNKLVPNIAYFKPNATRDSGVGNKNIPIVTTKTRDYIVTFHSDTKIV